MAPPGELRHGRRMFDPVEKLKEFIRHPSVSTDSKYHAGMKGAQEFVSGLLKSLGFSVEVVATELHPIIFAQRPGEADWPHVVIYGHYDVQPADPLNLWKTPAFEPTIIGNRIYGRGAAVLTTDRACSLVNIRARPTFGLGTLVLCFLQQNCTISGVNRA